MYYLLGIDQFTKHLQSVLQAITPPANSATTGPLPAAAAMAAAAVSAKIQAQDAAAFGGKYKLCFM